MQKDSRLLQILSYIHSLSIPEDVKEISKALNIPVSTTYRIIRTLKEWGFVTESHNMNGLIAGPTSYGAMHAFQEHSTIANIFTPFLKSLVHESKETAAVIVPTPHHTLCVALEESPSLLKCSFSLGGRQSLIKGASAKTILAFQDNAVTTTILEKNNCLNLLPELSNIKILGYGISVGEIDPDVWGVSFPIFKRAELLAVLTTMAPYYRAQTTAEKLISSTKKFALHINDFLSNSY